MQRLDLASGAVDRPVIAVVAPFDGVHRLHRTLLRRVRQLAESRRALVGAVVVDGGVHHRARVLTGLEHRLELLDETGDVDVAWTVDAGIFERPAAVLRDVLDTVRPTAYVSAADLRRADGTPFVLDDYRDLSAGSGVAVLDLAELVPEFNRLPETIFTVASISEHLAVGNVSVAGRLLGRPYEMRGIVEHGDERGRTIGFPTANLAVPERHLLPADGVYAGVAVWDDVVVPAAISLGRRPTFYEAGWELLEAHLIDFAGDLYGRALRVLFLEHLRPQRKFASVDALQRQLELDVALARELDVVGSYTASRAW